MTNINDQIHGNFAGSALAVCGFDVVAYFERQQPIEGKRDFTVNYQGLAFRFSSLANRKLFVSAPSRFVPQYGGHCAFAMSENVKSDIDPTAFAIVDAKLYLCKSSLVMRAWLPDAQLRITWANQNWSMLHRNTSRASGPGARNVARYHRQEDGV